MRSLYKQPLIEAAILASGIVCTVLVIHGVQTWIALSGQSSTSQIAQTSSSTNTGLVKVSAGSGCPYSAPVSLGQTAGGGEMRDTPAKNMKVYNPFPPEYINRAVGSKIPGTGLVDGPADPKLPNIGSIFGYKPSAVNYYAVQENADKTDVTKPWVQYLIGVPTNVGAEIKAPQTAYDIGGGKMGLVVYATNNQITIHVGRHEYLTGNGGAESGGYWIYLQGLCVNAELLAQYTANAGSRSKLPELSKGELLGYATGTEVFVAVRDNGPFQDVLDPEWWAGVDPKTVTVAPPVPDLGGGGGGGGGGGVGSLKALGQSCTGGADCESGRCEFVSTAAPAGLQCLVGQLTATSRCKYNSQCASGSCNTEFKCDRTAPVVEKKAVDGPCASDGNCTSDRCNIVTNKCVAGTIQNEQPCSDDSECQTRHCTQKVGNPAEKVCSQAGDGAAYQHKVYGKLTINKPSGSSIGNTAQFVVNITKPNSQSFDENNSWHSSFGENANVVSYSLPSTVAVGAYTIRAFLIKKNGNWIEQLVAGDSKPISVTDSSSPIDEDLTITIPDLSASPDPSGLPAWVSSHEYCYDSSKQNLCGSSEGKVNDGSSIYCAGTTENAIVPVVKLFARSVASCYYTSSLGTSYQSLPGTRTEDVIKGPPSQHDSIPSCIYEVINGDKKENCSQFACGRVCDLPDTITFPLIIQKPTGAIQVTIKSAVARFPTSINAGTVHEFIGTQLDPFRYGFSIPSEDAMYLAENNMQAKFTVTYSITATTGKSEKPPFEVFLDFPKNDMEFGIILNTP
ncbi:MAG: hypothetical protein WCO78_04810 [Candidatus Roizmanbacteria bacterium]